jgi:hypothetical protein
VPKTEIEHYFLTLFKANRLADLALRRSDPDTTPTPALMLFAKIANSQAEWIRHDNDRLGSIEFIYRIFESCGEVCSLHRRRLFIGRSPNRFNLFKNRRHPLSYFDDLSFQRREAVRMQSFF